MSDKKEQQQLPNDGQHWTYSNGLGPENKHDVQRYSVAENERMTTHDSNRIRKELEPQKDLDQEVEMKRWNEDVCTLVRLTFREIIIKQGDNYALRSGDVHIVFPEVHTLVDLYFFISQNTCVCTGGDPKPLFEGVEHRTCSALSQGSSAVSAADGARVCPAKRRIAADDYAAARAEGAVLALPASNRVVGI